MRIAVIGGGSMGLAFVRCWLKEKAVVPENLVVIESSTERRELLSKETDASVSSDVSLAKEAQLIFLAVKPQDFPELAGSLAPLLTPQHLIVSIMAGVSLQGISQSLKGNKRIVRVMPNLPVVVSKGISVFFAAPGLEPLAVSIVEQLLNAGGVSLRVENEELLNAVTAISGSGPGYVFYFLTQLESVCREFGFSEVQAKALISHTLIGSVGLWNKERQSAEQLCKLVTSKGGTTHAALSHFEKHNLKQVLIEGIKQAKKRADELSQTE